MEDDRQLIQLGYSVRVIIIIIIIIIIIYYHQVIK